MGTFNLQLFHLMSNEERKAMLQFDVNDMSCGHCVGAITAAVKRVAPEAIVAIDLPQHVVRVEGVCDAGAVELAICEAGFNPSSKA
jgi:copper chaperone